MDILKYILWSLKILVAGILLQTLFFKFTGASASVFIFTKMGIEPWGRYGLGVVELVTAMLILIPKTSKIGILLTIFIMTGAIFSHITVLGIIVQNDNGVLFATACIALIGAILIYFIQFKNYITIKQKTMIKVTSVIILSLFSMSIFAQKTKTTNQSISFNIGFASNQFSTATSYQKTWKLGKSQKFGIGFGGKLTNAFGSNQYQITAPAKLTSGKTGPSVLFAKQINKNIDSVLFAKSQVNALNATINFDYQISKKLLVGFNIDAIGFSFGGNKNATYFANSGAGTLTNAKPSGFNALLISDNDLGTLNSEFFAQYKLNDKWGAKLGFQFLFTEFTTATKVQTTPDGQKNDRFRYKAGGLELGINFKL